jgi:hypothetical protein
METEGSLPHSQKPTICPYPEPYQSSPCPPPPPQAHFLKGCCHKWPWPIQAPHVPSASSHIPFPLLRLYQRISPGLRLCAVFHNMVIFYGVELLGPRPTPKLEDHPLLADQDCLFNVFAATLHIQRPFLHLQPEDVPCRDYRDPLIMVANNIRGAKSTMCIRNFNLQRSQVRKRGKNGLNQSLIHIHPFPPTVTPNFLFAPRQLSSQKKTILR